MTSLNGQARALRAWAQASRAQLQQTRQVKARPLDQAPPPPPWLVVTGGKGGVGKTWFAVHLAQALRQASGMRVLLADLDPGLADVDVHLRIDGRYDIEDAMAGRCAPRLAVVPAPGGIHVLRGRSGAGDLSAGHGIDRAIEVVQAAAIGFDLVVCDTGAGIGPPVLAPLRAADLAIAVTTPDPAALTDCYALCKTMHRDGLAQPQLVINRAANEAVGTSTLGKLRTICERFLHAAPTALGVVRLDSDLQHGTSPMHRRGPAVDDVTRPTPAVLAALAARGTAAATQSA